METVLIMPVPALCNKIQLQLESCIFISLLLLWVAYMHTYIIIVTIIIIIMLIAIEYIL